MKKGITSTIAFELEIEVTDVAEVIFTFKEKIDSEDYLLQKSYPEEVTFENNKFLCKLTQEETDALTNTFFVEAQVNLTNKSVIKSDIGKEIMPPTLWTTFVEDNESSGEEEIIALTFTDYVEGGGSGGTTDYDELTNKPKINNVELKGNKTDTDLGLATKQELSQKQDTVSEGNGVDITNNVISVDLNDDTYNLANFNRSTHALEVEAHTVGFNETVRESLTDDSFNYQLASKQYVDSLMSGAVKRLVVQQLPTQDIDTNTIYMLPKATPQTNNVYDEYMYINSAWELIGTTEVDLSNYQTLITSTNKVNADYIDDSTSTNKFTNATEKAEWSANSRVYPAKFINGELDVRQASYPNIQRFDLLMDVDNQRFFYCNYLNEQGGIQGQWIEKVKSITSTPPATIDVSQDPLAELFVDDVLLSDNGNIYRVLTKDISSLPDISYTYQTYKGTDTTYSAGNGLSLSGGAFSVDNPVPSGTSSDYGKYLKNNNGTLEWASVSGGGSYTFGNGLTESSGTVSVDVSDANSLLGFASGKLVVSRVNLGQDTVIRSHLVDTNYNNPLASKSYVDSGLGNKQDTIDSSHKLSADNVDDTSTTNKFVTSTEKSTWNGKEDKTTISTDTTSTTDTLDLLNNTEQRYTQELSSLTLTLPLTIDDDFISSVVFKSGTTATQMTYDSSIKWSGDDVTSNAFVPSASKTYNIVLWYDGINVNGVVRGV